MADIRRLLLERLATIVLGTYLVGVAARALALGQWTYLSYLGVPVFAPMAAVTGVGLLVVGLLLWTRLTR